MKFVDDDDISDMPGDRLSLLPTRPVLTFSDAECHLCLAGIKLYCLVIRVIRVLVVVVVVAFIQIRPNSTPSKCKNTVQMNHNTVNNKYMDTIIEN